MLSMVVEKHKTWKEQIRFSTISKALFWSVDYFNGLLSIVLVSNYFYYYYVNEYRFITYWIIWTFGSGRKGTRRDYRVSFSPLTKCNCIFSSWSFSIKRVRTFKNFIMTNRIRMYFRRTRFYRLFWCSTVSHFRIRSFLFVNSNNNWKYAVKLRCIFVLWFYVDLQISVTFIVGRYIL